MHEYFQKSEKNNLSFCMHEILGPSQILDPP